MKKKLAAVALAVALVSLAVPALAFAGGYGQAADGARQGRGACFALCQATEALGGSMADLATTAAAHCGRGCFDGAQNRSQGAGCAASIFTLDDIKITIFDIFFNMIDIYISSTNCFNLTLCF